jgi:DNA mismatch repair protein MSH5
MAPHLLHLPKPKISHISIGWSVLLEYSIHVIEESIPRAVSGLSLESHAARCAQLFGVPAHVVQRAQYVTYVSYDRLYRKYLDEDEPVPLILVFVAIHRELLSLHELPKLLDEAISEEEQLDMDLASAVCQRFLEWDLETQEASLGEVRERLAQVLGRDVGSADEE